MQKINNGSWTWHGYAKFGCPKLQKFTGQMKFKYLLNKSEVEALKVSLISRNK